MIEVLAVLVVLVVVSTVVISRNTDVEKEAYSQASILKAHLRFAQSQAMVQNTESWGVAFASGAYILLLNGQPATFPWPNDTSSTHNLPDGVTLTASTPNLFFDEWGSPGETTITVAINAQAITITRNTGFIP
jgi:hypothetical protein